MEGSSVPCKHKKVRIVRNFFGIFSLLFDNCERRCLIFEIMAFLFGCGVRRNAIFSSSGSASGAVSLKLDAEAPKVAEKNALRYMKTFFV